MKNSKAAVRTARHSGSKSARCKSANKKVIHPKVTAYVRTAEGENWHFLFEFNDRNGRHRRLLIPYSAAHKDETLFAKLSDNGYAIPADNAARKQLQQLILEANPKRNIVMVGRPGWHGREFLLGDEVIGRGDEDLILAPTLKPHLARVRQRGELKTWRRNIADPSAYSSYLVFALCVGFAAPLLRFTDTEGGGFHFWGPSSIGKSTLQFVAATIFGRGARDGGYARTWKATAVAVDEIALGHSDHLLILDELQLLEGSPNARAQRASEIAYSIARGTPKSRSTHFSPIVPDELQHYRTLLLSSGEKNLAEHARAGANQRLQGEEVRLIDVPVPAIPSGIFDRLRRENPTLTSSVVAETLRQSAAQSYGVAGKAFVNALVAAHRRGNVQCLIDLIARRCKQFLRKIGVGADDGYANRFAKRFALTYAAGLLAIDYGIVPWKRSLVWRCVRRVYRQAISMQSRADESLEAAVAKVLGHLPTLLKQAVDIDKCTHREGRRAAKSESPLRLVHTDGHPLIALRPATLKKIIGTAIPVKAVAAELERRGLLISRGKGRRTRQVRVPGVAERHGYYCVRPNRVPSAI
jgi:hypothetical protein